MLALAASSLAAIAEAGFNPAGISITAFCSGAGMPAAGAGRAFTTGFVAAGFRAAGRFTAARRGGGNAGADAGNEAVGVVRAAGFRAGAFFLAGDFFGLIQAVSAARSFGSCAREGERSRNCPEAQKHSTPGKRPRVAAK
jgi:hypothetical protein